MFKCKICRICKPNNTNTDTITSPMAPLLYHRRWWLPSFFLLFNKEYRIEEGPTIWTQAINIFSDKSVLIVQSYALERKKIDLNSDSVYVESIFKIMWCEHSIALDIWLSFFDIWRIQEVLSGTKTCQRTWLNINKSPGYRKSRQRIISIVNLFWWHLAPEQFKVDYVWSIYQMQQAFQLTWIYNSLLNNETRTQGIKLFIYE